MSVHSGNPDSRAAGIWHLRKYRVRRIVATVLAITPPVLFACLAAKSGNWDLFERSGSITTAIGLLVASRRYIEHGVVELALHKQRLTPDKAEMLEDVVTAKLGLALSAFGTIVWGWGKYLGWWSFTLMLVWTLFAVRDVRRDSSIGGRIPSGEPTVGCPDNTL